MVPSDTTVVHGLCLGVLAHLEAPNLLGDSKHIKPHETHPIWIQWIGWGPEPAGLALLVSPDQPSLLGAGRVDGSMLVPLIGLILCLQLKAFLRHGLVKNG